MPSRTWIVLAFLAFVSAHAGGAKPSILPPELPWAGQSRSLIAQPGDPWITPAESRGLKTTPTYAETIAWLERLVAAAPELEMVSLGKSGEGRDVWMVIASSDRAFTPGELARTGKPIVLAQAGIHAGEIDGKDAGLMLLRDLSVRGKKRALLARAAFLFVPILNVDGHERASPHARMNQRGPEVMGWRTNARNLNLNRDYAKLDTPELRAVIGAINAWQPDVYVDLHVTDGIDYQYDVTWGSTGSHAWSPQTAVWLEDVLRPALARDLEIMGHVPGRLIFPVDNADVTKGLWNWTATPRFSDGYGSARHLPTILVENHSLKPYPQRVLGTYVWLESLLRHVGERGGELRAAVTEDRRRRPEPLPLTFIAPAERAPEPIGFRGVEQRSEPSKVSGAARTVWTGKPVQLEVPLVSPTTPGITVPRPKAYWIPPAWTEVIERLALHGVVLERTTAPREVEVEMYRLTEAVVDPTPTEGRVRVTATPVLERRREVFPAGSVRVATDQPLGDLAMMLLEPASPDSFFQWGFFLGVLQRTEYYEDYVMEPLAEQMLAQDPALRAEFEKKLGEDAAFAADPQARLRWFYPRTPYYDERYLLYPVARE